MNKERLDVLLANGSITKEEYEEMLSKMSEATNAVQDQEPNENEPKTNEFDEGKLDKLIQAKVDKITSKLGREKAELQKELEKLKREKLTDEEIKQLEIKEREKTLAEREQALLDRENRLYAIKAIKTAGLDDGSDISLELVDFVMADNEENINSKIKVFGDLVKKFVTAEVNKKFKDSGRTPNGSSGNIGSANPYSKETFNLTQQMKLETENPSLAAQLKQTAVNEFRRN